MLEPVPSGASRAEREARYVELAAEIEAMLYGEDDEIAALSTVVCSLHHAFEAFHWTGFYRVIAPELLAVGPYQGGHGCLRIPFGRGVCGAAARSRQTQLVADVQTFEDHIACSSSTVSEIVVPVLTPQQQLLAVLDIDSDLRAVFDELDQEHLEGMMAHLGAHLARRGRVT